MVEDYLASFYISEHIKSDHPSDPKVFGFRKPARPTKQPKANPDSGTDIVISGSPGEYIFSDPREEKTTSSIHDSDRDEHDKPKIETRADISIRLLKELAPHKAEILKETFAHYHPEISVMQMAQDIICAPRRALYRMPDADKIRALELLRYFKYEGWYRRADIVEAIMALSLATPLKAERRKQLEQIGDMYIQRVLDGNGIQAISGWKNMSRQERRRAVKLWHTEASDILNLPRKPIKFVDALHIGNEDNDFVNTGLHDNTGPITIAAGAAADPVCVLGTTLHETLHGEHKLYSGPLTNSSPLTDAFFKAQQYLHWAPSRIADDARYQTDEGIVDGDWKDTATRNSNTLYRGMLHEREAHYLDRYVEEKLRTIIALGLRNSTATYLFERSATLEVAPEKLLAILQKNAELRFDAKATEEAIFEVSFLEKPIFDLRIDHGRVTIDPSIAMPVQGHAYNIYHLQALYAAGRDTVTVRMPKEQLPELDKLLQQVNARPYVEESAPIRVPSFKEVFSPVRSNQPRLGSLGPETLGRP